MFLRYPFCYSSAPWFCCILSPWNSLDLIEYTLLMSFVALASAAFFIGGGKSVKGIWLKTSTQLSAANVGIS